MGKILKNWLIGIFGFVFCVTCGALGVMHYPTVENAVAEETLISYTDAESNMHPVYDGCMYWYQQDSDGSEIIMCWNKAEAKIYIAEFFM